MTKTEKAKLAAKFVVGTSVSFLVANVLRNNIETESNFQKAEIWIGSVALGVMAGEQTDTWTDAKIDAIVAHFEKAKITT